MWVSQLRLENFRNHTITDIALTPGITTFIGENGQGKTNLVEALVYLGTGGSHRATSDDVLVQNGHQQAQLTARIHARERSVTLSLTMTNRGSNKALVNNSPSSINELTSWLNVVIFSPEDVALVRGDPSLRRKFLDQMVVSLSPRMAGIYADYERVVKQRNMLLKSLRYKRPDSNDHETMSVWNEKLVNLASEITEARQKTLRRFLPYFSTAYVAIRPGHVVGLELSLPEELRDAIDGGTETLRNRYQLLLDKHHADERDKATTLFGPHRDDVTISLNVLPARTHSSQGEAWSLALALKLSTAMLHRDESLSGDPVIVLDDVFSELDRTRRIALAEAVADMEQVLITAAVESDIPEVLRGERKQVVLGEVRDG